MNNQTQKRRTSPESVVTLNLKALRNVSIISHEGKQYIAIPVQDNPTIFIGKEDITLDLQVFRKDPGRSFYGETHFLRPSLSSRARNCIPREQWNDYTGIMGNLTPYEVIMQRSQQRRQQAQAPWQGQYQQAIPQYQAQPQYPYPQQGMYPPQFQQQAPPPVYHGGDMPDGM